MMTRNRLAVFILPIAIVACSWKKTPVPIIPETGSVALLVGEWSGDYSSAQSGRSGTITFDLASEKDTAFCDVVMIPRLQPIQVAGERSGNAVIRPQRTADPLKLRFIRLGENRVSGTLDPYLDPDCECRVTTTFIGVFTAPDTIEGTFTTRGVATDYSQSGGRWRVTRQKSPVTSP